MPERSLIYLQIDFAEVGNESKKMPLFHLILTTWIGSIHGRLENTGSRRVAGASPEPCSLHFLGKLLQEPLPSSLVLPLPSQSMDQSWMQVFVPALPHQSVQVWVFAFN